MILTGVISDQLDFKHPKQISFDDVEFGEDGLMVKLDLNREQICVLMNSSYESYLLAFEAFCGAQS